MRKTLSLILVAFVAAACGNARPAGTTAQSQGSFPATIEASAGTVTIAAKPARIVSLSPTSTEILFAIGAGSQVVAVDDFSNYPASAPKTTLSGYEPNIEAIASYSPDLVVFSNPTLGEQLAKVGIVGIHHDAAAKIDDTYRQIRELGKATGHIADAEKVVTKMRTDIADIVKSAPKFDDVPTYYHELDSTFFSVTSKTFIGGVYALLGLQNIADTADKDGTGYPQLSPEYVIQSNPQLIFLADTKCCGQSAATVAKRPGWNQISAVSSNTVVALDDDIASRWGPRIVDFLRTVVGALETLEKAA